MMVHFGKFSPVNSIAPDTALVRCIRAVTTYYHPLFGTVCQMAECHVKEVSFALSLPFSRPAQERGKPDESGSPCTHTYAGRDDARAAIAPGLLRGWVLTDKAAKHNRRRSGAEHHLSSQRF